MSSYLKTLFRTSVFRVLLTLIIIMSDFDVHGFSCLDTTDVSINECRSLKNLYERTQGENWRDNTNWVSGTAICEWYGVSCEDSVVTKLHLSHNNLYGSLPDTMSYLSGLDVLSVGSQNQISPVSGSVYYFDGIDNYIYSVVTGNEYLLGIDKTYVVDIYHTTQSAGSSKAIIQDNINFNNDLSKHINGLWYDGSNGDRIFMVVSDGVEASFVTYSFPGNGWYRIVGVVKGNEYFSLYINGVEVSSGSLNYVPVSHGNIYIGGNEYFSGIIGDVQLRNNSRTYDDVVYNYVNNNLPFYRANTSLSLNDLMFRYPLTEGTGEVAYDVSGRGYHGTLVGGVSHVVTGTADYLNTHGYSLSGGVRIPAVLGSPYDAAGNPLAYTPYYDTTNTIVSIGSGLGSLTGISYLNMKETNFIGELPQGLSSRQNIINLYMAANRIHTPSAGLQTRLDTNNSNYTDQSTGIADIRIGTGFAQIDYAVLPLDFNELRPQEEARYTDVGDILKIQVPYKNTTTGAVSGTTIDYFGEYDIPALAGLETGVLNLNVKVLKGREEEPRTMRDEEPVGIRTPEEINSLFALWDTSITGSIQLSGNEVIGIRDLSNHGYDFGVHEGVPYHDSVLTGITLSGDMMRTIPTPFTADDDFTIVLFISSQNYVNSASIFGNKGYWTSGGDGVLLGNISNPQTPYAQFNSDSSFYNQPGIAGSPSTYTGELVVMVREGSYFKIYQDTTLAYTLGPIQGMVDDGHDRLHLGASEKPGGGGYHYRDGTFHFGAVYTKALSQAEIEDIETYLSSKRGF